MRCTSGAVDVMVIGAGLAGASLAYALAARGWSVLLADRHDVPRHKVCGEFLSPESSRSLVELGVEPLVRSLQPALIDKVRITSASGAVLEAQLPGQALGVSRYALDQVLLKAAEQQGVTVWTGLSARRIERLEGERGYRVELRSADSARLVEARALIGAWGRNGLSPKALASSPGSTYIGLKTHWVDAVDAARDSSAVELYFSEGGYVGVSPIEGGRLNAAALVTREAFRVSGMDTQGMWAQLGKGNSAFRARQEGAVQVPGTEAAVAPVNPGLRICAWDKAPHVGDAAAVIPPFSGDGMSLALRSVELCAELADRYLRGSVSLTEWRRLYETRMQAEFTGPLRWAGVLHAALQSRQLAPLLLRLGSLSPWLTSVCIRRTRLIR
jgi:menaquinone-9 beta-reductase